MKRIHPLTIAFAVVLVAIFLWIQSVQQSGYVLYWQHGITKSHVSYGWPVRFIFLFNNDTQIQLPPLLLNAVFAFALIAAPVLTSHRLLRHTRHIQLTTAFLLMLTAAALVYFNTKHIRPNASFETFGEVGWPSKMFITTYHGNKLIPSGLAINALVALALLSKVLLLSEFLLHRRNPPNESAAGPQARRFS